MVNTNDVFPDFRLQDQNGKEYTLDSIQGKWVILYCYPKDNTSGCSNEALEFSSLYEEVKSKNAEIIGLSPDSVESHRKFVAKLGIPFSLLSDPEHDLLTKIGVWQEKKMYGRTFMGVVRSTFLIDPQGIIKEIWHKVKVAGHAVAVMNSLKSHI